MVTVDRTTSSTFDSTSPDNLIDAPFILELEASKRVENSNPSLRPLHAIRLLLLPLLFTIVGSDAVPHPAEGVPERRPESLFEVNVVLVALLAVEGGERPGDAAVADATTLPARLS